LNKKENREGKEEHAKKGDSNSSVAEIKNTTHKKKKNNPSEKKRSGSGHKSTRCPNTRGDERRLRRSKKWGRMGLILKKKEKIKERKLQG